MLLDDSDKFTDYARSENRYFKDLFNENMQHHVFVFDERSPEDLEEKKFWKNTLEEAASFSLDHSDSLRFQGINAFSMHWNSTLADDQFFISLKRETASAKFIDPSLARDQILWSSYSAKKYLHRHSEEYALKVLRHFQTIKQITAEREILVGLNEVEPVLFIWHQLEMGQLDEEPVRTKLVMGVVVTRFIQNQAEDEEHFRYNAPTNSWSYYEEEEPF